MLKLSAHLTHILFAVLKICTGFCQAAWRAPSRISCAWRKREVPAHDAHVGIFGSAPGSISEIEVHLLDPFSEIDILAPGLLDFPLKSHGSMPSFVNGALCEKEGFPQSGTVLYSTPICMIFQPKSSKILTIHSDGQ